jgi:hypothetical protein
MVQKNNLVSVLPEIEDIEIPLSERQAEKKFAYLLKTNNLNYSDFFISTDPSLVRGFIVHINKYLSIRSSIGVSHLFLANIEQTLAGFIDYIDTLKKKKYIEAVGSPEVMSDLRNFLAVRILILKHQEYLRGIDLFANKSTFRAVDLFIRNMQIRKMLHESFRSAIKSVVKEERSTGNLEEAKISHILDEAVSKITLLVANSPVARKKDYRTKNNFPVYQVRFLF